MLDLIKLFERMKMKLEEVLEEFARKRKEIVTMFKGKPSLDLVIRKEDWLLVRCKVASA